MEQTAEFAVRRLMAVDADPGFCDALTGLGDRIGFTVTAVSSGARALATLRRNRPDLITLDLVLPDMEGLELLRQLRGVAPRTPILVFSGAGPARDIAAAIRCGATDFLRKPFAAEEFGLAVQKAFETRALTSEVEALRSWADLEAELAMACGDEPEMTKVRALVDQVADTNLTVLLRGESGTGKELIARALHLQSSRRGEPFVRLNCAALPSELLESELFGFERGAFTGAERRKLGKFEFADRGTIFLDEISEMPLSLQPKLLQVLQDGEFSPLGSVGDIRVDTRVLAATNVHLEALVAEGLFRRDLFYRLNVMTIRLPPLRERPGAIPFLVEHFRCRYNREYRRELAPLSEPALARLRGYAWPGNIRELENLIKRAVVLGSEQALHPTGGAARIGPRSSRGSAPGGESAAAGSGAVVGPELGDGPGARVGAGLRPGASAAEVAGAGVDPGVDPTGGGAGAGAGADRGTPDELDLAPLRSQLLRGQAVDLKAEERRVVQVAERRVMQRVLESVRWNRKEAAKRLDISYKALLYKMRDSGLGEVT